MYNLLIVLAEVVHAVLQGNQPVKLRDKSRRDGKRRGD